MIKHWSKIKVFALLFSISYLSVVHTYHATRKDCISNLRADLVFIVESSEAIDKISYEYYVKDYLNDITRELRIGEHYVLVSVVLYSDQVFMGIQPERLHNVTDVLMAIRRIPYLNVPRNKVNMGQALSQTLEGAFPPRTENDPYNTTRIVIILHSGRLWPRASGKTTYLTPTSTAGFRSFLGPTRVDHVTDEFMNPEELAGLRTLGSLFKSRVDYVFSIGLAGANSDGVAALASHPSYVFMLDQLGGYNYLVKENLDLLGFICPSNDKPRSCARLGVNNLLAEKTTTKSNLAAVSYFDPPLPYPFPPICAPWLLPFYYSPYLRPFFGPPIGPRFGPPPGPPPRRPPLETERARERLENLLRELIETRRGADDNTDRGLPGTLGNNLLPIIIVPQDMNQQVEGTFASKSTSQKASDFVDPWQYVKSKQRVQYYQPQLRNNGLNSYYLRQNGGARLIAPASHQDSISPPISSVKSSKSDSISNLLHSTKVEKAKTSENKDVDPHWALVKLEAFQRMIDAYLNNLRNNETQTTTTPIPVTTKTVLSPTLLVQHMNEYQLQMKANWPDVAMHEGALLLFSIKSNSGHSLAGFYSTATSDVNMDGGPSSGWFKHPDFDQWTVGVYRRVILELWAADQSVVRLTFDAKNADRYTWFQKSLLLESYPWTEKELMENGRFLRSRSEPFSIMSESQITQSSTKHGLSCPELRGYLLIADVDSSTSACPWLHNYLNTNAKTASKSEQFPIFLYGLHALLWNNTEANEQERIPPRFSDLYAISPADELRIYAVPYSLTKNSQNPQIPEAYKLLFALDVTTNISFTHLWHHEMSSSPGYHPLNTDDYMKSHYSLCSCWYRSRAVEHWHRPVNPTRWSGGTTVFTGFKQMRVQIADSLGSVVGQLIFDTRGAHPDGWFAPQRLRSAWPWSLEELRTLEFVQLGKITHGPGGLGGKHKSWRSIGLWIGKETKKNQLFNFDAQCTSVLLIMDGSLEGKGPDCMKGLEQLQLVSKTTTYMGYHANLATVEHLKLARQIAIWSE